MRVFLDNGDGSILDNGTNSRLLIAVGPAADENFILRLWEHVEQGLRLRYAAAEDRGLASDISLDLKQRYKISGMRKILAAVGSTARLVSGSGQAIYRGSISLISRLRS